MHVVDVLDEGGVLIEADVQFPSMPRIGEFIEAGNGALSYKVVMVRYARSGEVELIVRRETFGYGQPL